MPACAIAIALLCAPWAEKVTIRMESSAFGEGAAIETANGFVDFFYRSDNVFAGGWDSAARLCRAGRCIEYRREDNGAESVFLIRGADCDLARLIIVRGVTAPARDAILDRFALAPPHGSRADAVPLADLGERRTMNLSREERLRAAATADLDCTD